MIVQAVHIIIELALAYDLVTVHSGKLGVS